MTSIVPGTAVQDTEPGSRMFGGEALPSSVERIASYLHRHLTRSALIVSLHGITRRAEQPLLPGHVEEEKFQEAISLIHQMGTVVPLEEVVGRMRSGRDVAGLLAVTFDDSYASVLELGLPVLRHYGVPATVFVATGSVGSGRAYWWDRAERLAVAMNRTQWASLESEMEVPDSYVQGQPDEYGRIRPLRQWMLAHYQGRWPASREDVLDRWESELGLDSALDVPMTWDQLSTLEASGLVQLAPHTRSHPVLPLLPSEGIAEEISSALEQLRARSSDHVPILAYPFGLYDRNTVKIVARSGAMAACSVVAGRVRAKTPAFEIPRMTVAGAGGAWKLALKAVGLELSLRNHASSESGAYPELPSPVS